MANSKTKASIASRAKCSIAWAKDKKQKGELLIFKVDITNPEQINKVKNLKVSRAEFLRKALDLLNEQGELK